MLKRKGNVMPRRSVIARMLIGALVAGLVSACAVSPLRFPWEDPARSFGSDIARMIPLRYPVSRDNRVRIYVGGEVSYQAMLAFIRSARHTLYLEMFIFHDDASGRRMADLLVKRKKEGLDVKVRLDSLGLETGPTDRRILDRLRAGGVDVRIQNPYYVSAAGFDLTHRKILLADGDHALTGGANVGDEFRYRYYDAMVEVWGEAAGQIRRALEETWGPLPMTARVPLPRYGYEPLQVALTKPGSDQGLEIRRAYLTAIRSARRSIDLAFPYFYDDSLIKAVVDAATRGVAVRVLLPDWHTGNVFQRFNQAEAGQLLAAGAAVSLFPDRFLHLKYLAIDGAWTSLGSANGDSRSLRDNHELNLFFLRPETVRRIGTLIFDPLWTASQPVTRHDALMPPWYMRLVIPAMEALKGWF